MRLLRPFLFVQLFLLSIFPSSHSSSNFAISHRFKPHRSLHHRHRHVSYETRYFAQTLDHFDFHPQSYTTFLQRYLFNDKHWGGPTKGSPIFVCIGNANDIQFVARNTGLMFEIAPIFQALLVFVEHRYYGKSLPFGSKEVAFTNSSTLGYLSSAQALADVATLITDLKKNLTAEKSPVVVFGGSHGGTLATWFRLKYPHVAIGALASSAPILLFGHHISPYAQTDIITNDYRSESENCYKVIKHSWEELMDILGQPGGIEKLAKVFRICEKLPRDENLGNMLTFWVMNAVLSATKTDYPIPSNIYTPLPAYPVKKMCEAVDNPTTGNDTFARLYGAMNVYYNHTGTAACFDPNFVNSYDHGGNAWQWQQCTELMQPIQGNSNESIFPASISDGRVETAMCQDFGVAPRRSWITTEFGVHDIKRVLKRFGSNIIFFNGLRDPLSGVGVLESISESIRAIVAPKGAHNLDFLFSTKEDPKWLRIVRKREVRIITGWLQQYYNDSKSL